MGHVHGYGHTAYTRSSPCSRARAAAEDPIKRLFVEKLKDYQKKKPANENIKRVVGQIKSNIEAAATKQVRLACLCQCVFDDLVQ